MSKTFNKTQQKGFRNTKKCQRMLTQDEKENGQERKSKKRLRKSRLEKKTAFLV